MTNPDNQESGVSLPIFLGIAAVIVAGLFAAVWFALPGPDTKLRLVSPGGSSALELGELCTDVACNRVAILEINGARSGCPLDLPGSTPLLGTVTAEWSEDETAVAIDYGAAEALTFSRNSCTLTQ